MTSPASHLVGPTASHPYPAEVDKILSVTSYISPSFAINEFAKLIGLDTKSIAAWVTGDWESVARAADACRNLNEFSTSLAEEMRTQFKTLDLTWDGNSAIAAGEYFNNFSAQLDQIAESLTAIAEQLDLTVIGFYECIRALSTALELVIDLAITWAITARAATAAAASGVGAPVAGAVAAGGASALLYKGYQVVNTITTIHSKAVVVGSGPVGLITANLATFDGFSEMTVPQPYTNHVTS